MYRLESQSVAFFVFWARRKVDLFFLKKNFGENCFSSPAWKKSKLTYKPASSFVQGSWSARRRKEKEWPGAESCLSFLQTRQQISSHLQYLLLRKRESASPHTPSSCALFLYFPFLFGGTWTFKMWALIRCLSWFFMLMGDNRVFT